VNAGRILVRALVVIGGAAVACAIAWLTATASASTVGQVVDEPIGSSAPAVVTTIADPQPPVLSRVKGSVPVAQQAATSALAGAAAHTTRLAGVLDTSATRAVASVPVAVRAVGRIAVAATGLTAPAGSPRDHIENPPVGSGAAGQHAFTHARVDSGPQERPAGRSSTAIPARAAMPEIAGRPLTDRPSEHGADGLAGRSWPPSCVIPASAGFTAGHDRGCGDAVQPFAAEHPQSSLRRSDGSCQAVTSAEIRPGVTPD
jgi:hypothetical protein